MKAKVNEIASIQVGDILASGNLVGLVIAAGMRLTHPPKSKHHMSAD